MKRCWLFILLNTICFSGYAQNWGVQTAINSSYSGISQSFRAAYTWNKVVVGVGPKLSLSKHRFPWKPNPGISANIDYNLTNENGGKVFFLYEMMSTKNAVVHEAYVGYV